MTTLPVKTREEAEELLQAVQMRHRHMMPSEKTPILLTLQSRLTILLQEHFLEQEETEENDFPEQRSGGPPDKAFLKDGDGG